MRTNKAYTPLKVRVAAVCFAVIGGGCFFAGMVAPAGDHRFRILAAAGIGLTVAGLILQNGFTKKA